MRVILALWLALVATPVSAQYIPPGRDSTLTLFFLDVGQGDATWLITGTGRRVLIDAGPSERAIATHLWEGPDTLDLVVASHAHADHIGGMPWVFQRFVVRNYMDNGVPFTTSVYGRVLAALRREPGVRYLEATERVVSVDSLRLRILPPHRKERHQNLNSVGVVVEFGKFRALLAGDSERRQIERWIAEKRLGPVHVLKAPHHGAANGFTDELAALTRPGLVIISAGKRNRYGHPSASVVQGWARTGAEIMATHVDGDVMVVAKLDGTYAVQRFKVLSAPIRTP